MSRAEKNHEQHTHSIAVTPSIIGLDGIVLSTAESHLFRPNGEISREPDNLLFDPSTHTLYNIEYKSTLTPHNTYKAINQLKTSGKELRKVFDGWTVINLYVAEDYKVEQL